MEVFEFKSGILAGASLAFENAAEPGEQIRYQLLTSILYILRMQYTSLNLPTSPGL
jgi:hypothetical protein